MEIRAIVADDEPLARAKLRVLLKAEPDVRLVAECEDGGQTLAAVRDYRPELLLLDIEMPQSDGFEVLEALAPEEMPIVIFTTAYNQYAVKAFEAHALDYLLKPFDQERLHKAMERARVQLSHRNGFLDQRVRGLLADSRYRARLAGRLVIKSGGRVIFLSEDEIDWIEAAVNYIRIHTGKEAHLMRESISRIAARLDPSRFIRVHRSVIVNVTKIPQLQPCNSGEYIVVLRDGKELPCSRGYRSALESFLK